MNEDQITNGAFYAFFNCYVEGDIFIYDDIQNKDKDHLVFLPFMRKDRVGGVLYWQFRAQAVGTLKNGDPIFEEVKSLEPELTTLFYETLQAWEDEKDLFLSNLK